MHSQDTRNILSMSNRWTNTVYTGYGRLKQRIFLELLQLMQSQIKKVMFNGGDITTLIPAGHDFIVALDMNKVANYNNYYQVRTAVKEMSTQAIDIYADPTFKKQEFFTLPLLNGYDATKEKRIILVRIKKNIAELMMHVDYKRNKSTGKWRAEQYVQFDRETINYSSSRYMFPLYTMISSYSEKGGFNISVEELRLRLQVPDKYAGFDNLNRFVLKHIQEELKRCGGKYSFNYTQEKQGNKVKRLAFKVFANNVKFNYNDVWLKIQRALTEELPHFARLTDEQREETNYLLNGSYNLDEVLKKILKIHAVIETKKQNREKISSVFQYLLRGLHEKFPPPEPS